MVNFDRKKRFRFIVILAVTYISSTILLIIGFFTPWWLIGRDVPHRCNTVGIITGSCRFPFGDDTGVFTGAVFTYIFWTMLSALSDVFLSVVMVTVTFVLRLENNSFVMSLVGVIFGVYYPVAALQVFVCCTMVEDYFPSDVGYSTVISRIAGLLMLLFYVLLIVYDIRYVKSKSNGPDRTKSKEKYTEMKA